MTEKNWKALYEAHDIKKADILSSVLSGAAAKKPAPRRRLRTVLAVCIPVLLLICGLSVYAAAAEAEEYREAVEFFDENSIPTEGMTRGEIKAVYRDVTEKTYSYEKTLEILNDYSVEFRSAELGTLSKEELDLLWNEMAHSDRVLSYYEEKKERISYDVLYGDEKKEENGILRYDRYLVKKENGQEKWRYLVPYEELEFVLPENIHACENGVLLLGCIGGYGSWKEYAAVLYLDKMGNRVWYHKDTEGGLAYDTAVSDGEKIYLFGSGSSGKGAFKTVFTVLDTKGNVLSEHHDTSDRYLRYMAAAKCGDKFFVRYFADSRSQIGTWSENGEKLESYTYSEGGIDYAVKDLISVGGRVYLSADKPKDTYEEFCEKAMEIEREHFGDLVFETEKSIPETDGQLLVLFSGQHTAVLLSVGEDGTVGCAYEIPNAEPGTLSTDEEGNLLWQVIRYDRVLIAPPCLNSRRFDLDCTEFSFVFTPDGQLKEKKEIGYYPSMY